MNQNFGEVKFYFLLDKFYLGCLEFFLGGSSFFSKWSTTHINLESHFFLSIKLFFSKLRVVLWTLTTLHYTWRRQWMKEVQRNLCMSFNKRSGQIICLFSQIIMALFMVILNGFVRQIFGLVSKCCLKKHVI